MSNVPNVDVSSSLTLELTVTQSICSIVGSPRALTVWMLCEYKEFEQLARLTIDPLHYNDSSAYADDCLCTDLLRKSPSLPLEVDKHCTALDSFYESETACGIINEKLEQISVGGLPPLIEKARTIIFDILGPLSSADLQEIEAGMRFGPGATTGVKGVGSVTSDKFDASMHLTCNLIPFYRALLGEGWWEHQPDPVIVPGNKYTTVPKTSLTNRGICVEPTLNSFLQLGIGALLTKKLRRRGVNLNSQVRNQYLAKKAYYWDLSTIDLSAASDSIAYHTVTRLLPPRWVELLDLARSPSTCVDGVDHVLQKYSSMGNGFTFQLETLIFLSLVLACTGGSLHNVAVYGDDIVVPRFVTGELIDALEFLGFKVNPRKSFLAGNFFESCGQDFFKGTSVRPFYLKRDPDSHLPYTVQIGNALRLYSSMRCNGMGCDGRFRDLWLLLVRKSPKPWSDCRVPPSLGDLGVICSPLEKGKGRFSPRKPKHGLEGLVVMHMKLVPRKRRKTSLGFLFLALQQAGITASETRGLQPVRGLFGRYSLSRSLVSEWPAGLEWIT